VTVAIYGGGGKVWRAAKDSKAALEGLEVVTGSGDSGKVHR